MKKRFFSILLSLAMMVTMMPGMVVFADQPAVTYLKADGTSETITDYQIMPECSGEAATEISSGTYVVNSSNMEETASPLKILGDTRIIIKKGCTLYINGINLNGNKLDVFEENNSTIFAERGFIHIYGSYHSSAIFNGEFILNSGGCFMLGGATFNPRVAMDTLSADSKLTVNNGYVEIAGISQWLDEESENIATDTIAGRVGTGNGITINNCIDFKAWGGIKYQEGAYEGEPEKEYYEKAFLSSDASKFTLNGEYEIVGFNYNISTKQLDDGIMINQNDFTSQLHLYNMINIAPKWNGGGTGGGGGAGGSGETAPEVNAPSVDVTDAVLVKTENGKATASVDVTSVMDDLIKTATDGKTKEITINAKTSANVDKVDVTIPADAFAQLAKIDSLNDAVISTGVCDFTIDKQALAEIAKQSPAGSKLTIEAVESPTSNKLQTVYELKITAGNKKISSFNGGQIMVTVDVPSELKGKPATCLYKNEKGVYSGVTITKWSGDNAKLSFVTQHFSKYIVMSEDEATKLLVKQAKPKQKSIKALKGKKIAVSFKKLSIGNVSADAVKYTVQRSTSKKFKKAVKNFTVKSNKSVIKYTDSKKLKKGTKYYYRVRATVLLSNGSKVNSKWSTAKSAKCK